ncbi:hypothetical protein EU805_13190 [Salipiger sp. IMCC34102]|uniref:DUF6525 family protein n=1 Tax=Salipiger sp. IMCC34102 TaxID=2510647 RepID=UPI00101D3AEC|nr:DUF6525 family protein [Salipiger sp. IMCC34102]RYH01608.1 hypothetical protein EU805_13190 [Salipiger sp. IMCC34102]
MSRNLGQTSLKRRQSNNPMRDFDALPPELRRWLADASLPWSPRSCRRIWMRARSDGCGIDTVLARLDRAQAKTLARDTVQIPGQTTSFDTHRKT